MKNEEIIEEIGFIDEGSYQQIKKEMCKANDYFTLDEWKILKKLTTF